MWPLERLESENCTVTGKRRSEAAKSLPAPTTAKVLAQTLTRAGPGRGVASNDGVVVAFAFAAHAQFDSAGPDCMRVKVAGGLASAVFDCGTTLAWSALDLTVNSPIMHITRALVLAFVGCRGSTQTRAYSAPPRASVVPFASVTTPATQAPSSKSEQRSTTILPSCSASLLAYQASELKQARKDSKLGNEMFSDFEAWLRTLAENASPLCVSSWAIVFKSFRAVEAATSKATSKDACNYLGAGLCVNVTLVHESANGERVELALTQKYRFLVSNTSHFQPTQMLSYDFDGDGSPEWVTIWEKWEHESTAERILTAHTFRTGRIQTFAMPVDAYPEELRDVDGDGRPDLVGHFQYSSDQVIACGSGFNDRLSGPKLLWHSLAGGLFTNNDEVAKTFAGSICGTRPDAGKVFGGEPREHEASYSPDDLLAARGVCARIWGVPLVALKKEAQKTHGLGSQCEDGTAVPSTGRVGTILQRWLAEPPPFKL
jgi:hypothetical protein